jgi:hypothetical protein
MRKVHKPKFTSDEHKDKIKADTRDQKSNPSKKVPIGRVNC